MGWRVAPFEHAFERERERIIERVRAAYWNNSVAVPLVSGALIVVDNMLAGHGRMGWVPPHPRKVLLTHFTDATW